jgi:hypothetical protein
LKKGARGDFTKLLEGFMNFFTGSLFKGGIISVGLNPSLEKHALSLVEGRGTGDFQAE